SPEVQPAPPGQPQQPQQHQQPPPPYAYTPPGLPAHLAPYALPQQEQPGQGYAPQGQPNMGYPFQPYPGAPQPSFTKQMQAPVELDEIPAHYRLGSSSKSW